MTKSKVAERYVRASEVFKVIVLTGLCVIAVVGIVEICNSCKKESFKIATSPESVDCAEVITAYAENVALPGAQERLFNTAIVVIHVERKGKPELQIITEIDSAYKIVKAIGEIK